MLEVFRHASLHSPGLPVKLVATPPSSRQKAMTMQKVMLANVSNPQESKHHLYMCDCLEGVKVLRDNSLDLILSSPPYFDFVVYSQDKANMSTLAYDDYLSHIAKLWAALAEKLKPGGIVALWLHDIYEKSDGFLLLRPLHADLIKTFPPSLSLRNVLIWDRYARKPVPTQPKQKNRRATKFQYVLFFSKGATRYEQEFFSLLFRPIWVRRDRFEQLSRLIERLTGLRAFKNKKDYLTVCSEHGARMVLRTFSRKGDTICDPFLGSGTTMKVADELGRSCIGFEINRDAQQIILNKVGTNAAVIVHSPSPTGERADPAVPLKPL